MRVDRDAENTSVIVGDGGLGRRGLVVLAPVVLINGNLASRASTPWLATGRGCGAFGTGKVKGLGQDNDTSRAVAEVGNKLVVGGRVDCSRRATTSYAFGKTLSGSGDTNAQRARRQRRKGGQEEGALHYDKCDLWV